MMNVKELLRSKGLRYGKVRANFLQHLFDASTPLSAVDILKKPNMKGVNKSTIYRNIDEMLAAGIIESVYSNSEAQLFEIASDHHHHHFNCTSCGWIQCLDVSDVEVAIRAVEEELREQGLEIQKHILGFEGVCQNCK